MLENFHSVSKERLSKEFKGYQSVSPTLFLWCLASQVSDSPYHLSLLPECLVACKVVQFELVGWYARWEECTGYLSIVASERCG